MIGVIERPEPYCFSRNAIRYRLQITNPTAPGMEVQIRLYTGNTGDALADVLVTTIVQVPPTSGIMDVYVEDIIDSYLTWQMPNPAREAITVVTQQSKGFFIEYRQVSTAYTGAWKSELSNRRIALKGGYPKLLNNRSRPQSSPNAAYSYQTEIRVGLEDHFYKSFLQLTTENITAMEAELRVYYNDGSTQIRTIAFPGGSFSNIMFHVPAGLYTWDPAFISDELITYYEIAVLVTTIDGTATVPLCTCLVDYNPYQEVVAFNYHNSLGALDYMRLLGDTDIETERNFTEGEAIVTGNYNQQVKDWQYFQKNINLLTSFKGDAGFFVNPLEQAIAQEIDLSESVWQAVEYAANVWTWIRVLVLNKNRKLRAASDTKWSFPIEWSYGYNESQFSALAYTGAGADSNTYVNVFVCGVPSGLASTVTPFGPGLVTAGVSWTVGGGADKSVWEIKESTDSVWIVNETTGNAGARFVATGKTFNWRVKTVCGDGEESAYVNGTNIVT